MKRTHDLSEIKMLVSETKEEMTVVEKFEKYKKGIKLDPTKPALEFDQLVNCKMNDLLYKLKEINKLLLCLEEGYHNNIAFYHTESDENNEINIISFTWQECKEFLKAAIDAKKQTPKYQSLINKYDIAMSQGDVKTLVYVSKLLGY